MAGRKRHTPEQIIRKLRHGDELAAKGIDVEEIARQLDVSVPTLYDWRKQYMNPSGRNHNSSMSTIPSAVWLSTTFSAHSITV